MEKESFKISCCFLIGFKVEFPPFIYLFSTIEIILVNYIIYVFSSVVLNIFQELHGSWRIPLFLLVRNVFKKGAKKVTNADVCK